MSSVATKKSQSRNFSSGGGNLSQEPFVVKLPHRKLIAIGGKDASSFLQGLTTNNIPFDPPDVDTGSGSTVPALYAAFLTAQGRILQDVFIYAIPTSSALIQNLSVEKNDGSITFLVEIDQSQSPSFIKTLRRYKLRSKVSIREVDTNQLGAAFRSMGENSSTDSALKQYIQEHTIICAQDQRAPGLGYRILGGSDQLSAPQLGPPANMEDYRLHRYLYGVPEGQEELPSEHALVHESGLDVMLGVDFRKGCYVGQELVIRTQHTGVVRKRIMPVALYKAGEAPPTCLKAEPGLSGFDGIPYGADIKQVGDMDSTGRKIRSAGKWVANIGNIGLALVRLETMAGLGPTGELIEDWQAPEFAVDTGDGESGNPRVRAFVPSWWAERKPGHG